MKSPELEKCLDYIRERDTLHIHSMDCLARNLKDLQTIVEFLNDGLNKSEITKKISVSRQTLYKALKNVMSEFKQANLILKEEKKL